MWHHVTSLANRFPLKTKTPPVTALFNERAACVQRTLCGALFVSCLQWSSVPTHTHFCCFLWLSVMRYPSSHFSSRRGQTVEDWSWRFFVMTQAYSFVFRSREGRGEGERQCTCRRIWTHRLYRHEPGSHRVWQEDRCLGYLPAGRNWNLRLYRHEQYSHGVWRGDRGLGCLSTCRKELKSPSVSPWIVQPQSLTGR